MVRDKSLLENSDSLQEDILDDTKQMLGTVPFILQVMARRPEFMIFSCLKDFYALRPKSLDTKIAELLAAAARAGRARTMVQDAVFIAAIIGQTKVLAFALRTFQEFEGGSKEK